jgi:hypothetical protein
VQRSASGSGKKHEDQVDFFSHDMGFTYVSSQRFISHNMCDKLSWAS